MGRIRLIAVLNATALSLCGFVRQNVAPGAHVKNRRAPELPLPAKAGLPSPAGRAWYQPEERDQADAQRAPGLLAAAPLAAWHLPGRGSSDPPAVVPRRIRLPLQPPTLS